MILIFDLDDTLYPEITYVHSGFRAVAIAMQNIYGWNKCESFEIMSKALKRDGRGSIFDSLLSSHGIYSRMMVKKCVSIYRQHNPNISLPRESRKFLNSWPVKPYLVTDGNKIVQERKVSALNLWPKFRKVFITHRYGLHNAKPSTYCFKLIKNLEGCAWNEMIYVGDNPAKDFVGLNSIGVKTVRLLTGEHASTHAMAGFDASFSIENIRHLAPLLNSFK